MSKNIKEKIKEFNKIIKKFPIYIQKSSNIKKLFKIIKKHTQIIFAKIL